MKNIILARLAELEASESIRIVYACESGSRAWGFASTDSDYDVRFIYVRPVDWYLSILDRRDVIEQPIFSPLTGVHHYLQMARGSVRDYLPWSKRRSPIPRKLRRSSRWTRYFARRCAESAGISVMLCESD